MKRKFRHEQQPETFSNLIWLIQGSPSDVKFIAAQNKLVCVCYLSSTPITDAVWFHVKEIVHA